MAVPGPTGGSSQSRPSAGTGRRMTAPLHDVPQIGLLVDEGYMEERGRAVEALNLVEGLSTAQRYIQALARAERSVRLVADAALRDPEVHAAMQAALDRGVKVRVLDPDPMEVMAGLVNADRRFVISVVDHVDPMVQVAVTRAQARGVLVQQSVVPSATLPEGVTVRRGTNLLGSQGVVPQARVDQGTRELSE